MSSTPLQVSGPWSVYADPAATMSGGTPLILAVSKAGKDVSVADYITVKLKVLLSYERAIFDLQREVMHYKSLVDVLTPRRGHVDELRLESRPLNAASVRVLNSIVNARIPNSVLRGMDEED